VKKGNQIIAMAMNDKHIYQTNADLIVDLTVDIKNSEDTLHVTISCVVKKFSS